MFKYVCVLYWYKLSRGETFGSRSLRAKINFLEYKFFANDAFCGYRLSRSLEIMKVKFSYFETIFGDF